MSMSAISVKFLRNQAIFFHNDIPPIQPSVKMVTIVNGMGSMSVPEFDMDALHPIPLKPELPEAPPKEDWMTDEYYRELQKESFAIAIQNKRDNEFIRKQLDEYVLRGILKIVHDPYKKAASAKKPVKTPRKRAPRKKSEG